MMNVQVDQAENVEIIRELIHEDRRQTIHELADTTGQLWSLPGDLNRKFEYAPNCSFIMTMSHPHIPENHRVCD
jgi:hypothetical protein